MMKESFGDLFEEKIRTFTMCQLNCHVEIDATIKYLSRKNVVPAKPVLHIDWHKSAENYAGGGENGVGLFFAVRGAMHLPDDVTICVMVNLITFWSLY